MFNNKPLGSDRLFKHPGRSHLGFPAAVPARSPDAIDPTAPGSLGGLWDVPVPWVWRVDNIHPLTPIQRFSSWKPPNDFVLKSWKLRFRKVRSNSEKKKTPKSPKGKQFISHSANLSCPTPKGPIGITGPMDHSLPLASRQPMPAGPRSGGKGDDSASSTCAWQLWKESRVLAEANHQSYDFTMKFKIQHLTY